MKITTIPTGVYQTNTYIFDCGNGEAIAIDTGSQPDLIEKAAEKLGLKIKYVLLTHSHWDHIGAVAHFQKNGAKVYMHKADSDLLNECFLNGEYESIPKFLADEFVVDGQVLELGNKKINVIHTPGHTQGGVCYCVDSDMFSGDTLFLMSIGRSDLPSGDYKTLIKSVKGLFELETNFTVYPGHGDSTSIDYERRFNPYV